MNNLMLISFIISVSFGVLTWYYQKKTETLESINTMYKQNNKMLEERLRKVYDSKATIEKRNIELEKAVQEDKTNFDWNADISNSPVIKRLQKH